MDSPIKNIQINLHHAKGASDVKSFTIKNNGLVLIQEPWVKNGKIMGVSRSGKVLYNTTHDHSRASILINKNVKYFFILELTRNKN